MDINISYDSSELIEELKEDIQEFGNMDVWAIFSISNGANIYRDYDFVMDRSEMEQYLDEDEEYPAPIKLEVGETKKKMKALELLEILEEQNSIF